MNWEIYTENKVVAHSGWYYVNQDVADKVESFNGGSIKQDVSNDTLKGFKL